MLKRVSIQRMKKHGFSLILSGGAALGVAHLGVLKWLEENQLVPDEIIGTSMGSIIAALWVTGHNTSEIAELINEYASINVFKLKYVHGHFERQGMDVMIKKTFKKLRFSDATIPLKIVAAEAKTGKARVFSAEKNYLLSNVTRASIAVPGYFTFKKIGKTYYMDGGVASNLPVEFAMKGILKIASNTANLAGESHYNRAHGIFSGIRSRIRNMRIGILYLLRNQTYAKVPYIKKLVLIEPNLSKYNGRIFEGFEKMIGIAYDEAKKKIYK